MKIPNKLKVLGWVVVYALLAMNIAMLYFKVSSIKGAPFEWMQINKPTLVVILDEFECAICVENLKILNRLSKEVQIKDRIDFRCVIASKTKTDSKRIAPFFSFPVTVTNDFKIFRRLNINKTPILLGLSPQKQIIYSELIPPTTALNENYLKDGILDRLFYAEFGD